MPMPHTLAAPVHSELLIRKSRFIGCVQAVPDRATAQRIVTGLRGQHPGATAGRPMLEVLRHQDLEGVLASVVRYFGGIRLGAGGLVRAYTDCIAQVLRTPEKVPLVRLHTLRCRVPYALEGLLRREIAGAGASLLEVRHSEAVEFVLTLPDDVAKAFVATIGEAGQGRVAWLETHAANGAPRPPD